MAEVRRQDQVPLQNQDNNPVESTSLEQSPAHEPLLHTRTSLEDAVAQRALKGMDKVTGDLGIPDRIPRGLVENPDAGGAREVVPGDKKKSPWVKRGVATLAGALAISVGAGIVHYKNTKDAIENSPLNVGGGDRSTSAPAVPGQEGGTNSTELAPLDMYNTDITHAEYGRQLQVTLPYLQERRAQSMQEASDELDLQNRVNTLKESELPADPAKRKAQIDQNNITADLWTISKETNTVLARNLLGAVFRDNPNSNDDAFDNNARLIGNGKGRILAPATVMDVSPTYTSGSVGGVAVDGQPTYLVKVVDRTEKGDMYEMVMSQRYSQDRSTEGPVVVKVIHYGQSDWVDKPSQMAP